MWVVTMGATGGVSPSIVNQIYNVTLAAAQYWSRYVDDSLASIDIQVDIAALGGTSLAQAGTDYYLSHSNGGLDYYEPATVVELSSGVDLNGASPDISVEIDLATINDQEFDYSSSAIPQQGKPGLFSLWTILVHEIGHGLGLLTFIDEGGTDRTTFDNYVTNVGGNYFFDGPDPNFGPIALDGGIAHIASSTVSVLNPSISPNQVRYLTARDISIFGDFGAPVRAATNVGDALWTISSSATSLNGDAIHGLDGNDTIIGLPGQDVIYGDAGNDSLYGGGSIDQLYGGDGDDTLVGSANYASTIDGGAGADFVDYSNFGAGITVNLGRNGVFGSNEVDDIFVSIEGAIGTAFNDWLLGYVADETLLGGAGVDTLEGYLGNDWLDGGDNKDRIFGGLGADTLIGGDGDDTLKGDEGNDAIFAGLGNDRSEGGDGDDFIRTSNGGDTLIGGAGIDTLGAGSGGDLIRGGDDADLVLGSNGNDRLYGDDGDDTLLGGGGRDTLIGGAGADRLVGGSENDGFNFSPGSGADTIVDFVAGQASDDVIRLIGFGAFDDFTDILAAASQAGANVFIDLGNGDSITLQGVNVAQLHADDFVFG